MPKLKYGIAIDLGTTNIAAVLLDLEEKKEIEKSTLANSQNRISPDIVTRIQEALTEDGKEKCRALVYKDINEIVDTLVSKSTIDYSMIDKILVVANPAMMHFFLGADVAGLSKFPYEFRVTGKEILEGTQLNEKLVNAKIFSLPLISGFIGSDFICSVLSTKLLQKTNNKILVDLGTNAEIGLWNGENLLCTSAAAGAAFGFKGSEVISNVATMLKFRLVSNTGVIVDSRYKGIISPIMVRSLQLAKAAVRSAIEILLNEGKVNEKELKEIYLAGVFGELMHPWSAMFIGMVPSIDVGKIKSVGNAALAGGVQYLLGEVSEDDLNEVITKTKVIYLNEIEDFQSIFIRNINF